MNNEESFSLIDMEQTEAPQKMTVDEYVNRALASHPSTSPLEADRRVVTLFKEYYQLLAEGKIVGPSEVEQLLNTANAPATSFDEYYEDLYEILTARRSLTKRGIDWQTGEPLKKNVPDMDNTPEPVGRIEYLDTRGTVVHGVEYTDAQKFEEDIWSLAGHHGSVIVYRNQKSQTILDHDPPVSLRIMDYDEWRQTADIPSAPLEPIGCIEYLDYNDDVVGSVEFTNAEKFEANINDPDWYGYDQRIVSYRNPEKQATKRQSFKESFAKLFARIEKERSTIPAGPAPHVKVPQRER